MTTSEFIIGHSADDAADRKAEAHKILWALLAALAIHLVIGYCIATFSGVFSSPIQVEEDKPVELTFVDLGATPPVEAKKNSMFVETDESKASVEAPKEKRLNRTPIRSRRASCPRWGTHHFRRSRARSGRLRIWKRIIIRCPNKAFSRNRAQRRRKRPNLPQRQRRLRAKPSSLPC